MGHFPVSRAKAYPHNGRSPRIKKAAPARRPRFYDTPRGPKWAAKSSAEQEPPPLFEKPVQRAFLASLMGGTKPRIVGTTPRMAGRQSKPARKPKSSRS
jgi:hypothetical protein